VEASPDSRLHASRIEFTVGTGSLSNTVGQMDIFDLVPAAERIKNVDQAIVGSWESFSVPSSLPASPQGELLLVVRKERTEAAKDRLSRANELKTAARLIVDDFFIAQVAATEFVEKKRWVPGTARNFPLDACRKIGKSSPANYRSKIGIR